MSNVSGCFLPGINEGSRSKKDPQLLHVMPLYKLEEATPQVKQTTKWYILGGGITQNPMPPGLPWRVELELG